MKKTIFIALLAIFSLSAAPVFATNSSSATESTYTKEEASILTSRIEEIRVMDKSNLTATEKSNLKSELKDIKDTMKSDPYIYIGGSTLIILIVVLIILL